MKNLKMSKFWKWMEDKGYGVDEHIYSGNGYTTKPTNQALIGYMIEYCIDKKIPLIPKCDITSIDMMYEFLITTIEVDI